MTTMPDEFPEGFRTYMVERIYTQAEMDDSLRKRTETIFRVVRGQCENRTPSVDCYDPSKSSVENYTSCPCKAHYISEIVRGIYEIGVANG